jgi:hypothetical protein
MAGAAALHLLKLDLKPRDIMVRRLKLRPQPKAEPSRPNSKMRSLSVCGVGELCWKPKP